MHTVSPPLPAADDLETHRLILRDGSVAAVRPAGPSDRGRCAFRGFWRDDAPPKILAAVSELLRRLMDRQPTGDGPCIAITDRGGCTSSNAAGRPGRRPATSLGWIR